MQSNSDVFSDVWFTVEQLAEMGLRGYPRTARNWHNRAKADGWKSREVASAGRTGYRTEYSPPHDVMALIEARKRGELPAAVMSEPDAHYGSDAALIDRYVDVRGSAGPGSVVLDEAIVKVRVDAKLLRERVGSNFSYIKMAGVSGDSMEPTLSHGDQVLVDTSCNRFVDDAIYAIQQDGHLRFKRIQLKLDGSIVVRSDASENIETYTAEQAAAFYVVGMVIPFKFGRFKV